MQDLYHLVNSIIEGSLDLTECGFDVRSCPQLIHAPEKRASLHAIHGATGCHPIHLEIRNSSVPGTYFLGKCVVEDSFVYMSDLRGDELKSVDSITIHEDEVIRVQDSYLLKALVHSNSHDPENPHEFLIRDSVAMHYSNIHGSPLDRCLLKPFATIDLTAAKGCTIGTFSSIHTGKLEHRHVEDGTIWVGGKDFELKYAFDRNVLQKYIRSEAGQPCGILMDFLNSREGEFSSVYSGLFPSGIAIPESSFVNPYALVKGHCTFGERTFVSQRAYIENAFFGDGSNAQENCFIIDSVLEGNNVSAHGSKIIGAHVGKNVFVGFNSFLRAGDSARLLIGEKCIVAPHTIIDLEESVEIPPNHLVWGYISNRRDLENHSILLDELAGVSGEVTRGALTFRGKGEIFVKGFRHRVEHILECNGALCTGEKHHGHAQKCREIAFNVLQPYWGGVRQGLFPSISIRG